MKNRKIIILFPVQPANTWELGQPLMDLLSPCAKLLESQEAVSEHTRCVALHVMGRGGPAFHLPSVVVVASPIGSGREMRLMGRPSEIYPTARQEARRQVLTDSFCCTGVGVDLD